MMLHFTSTKTIFTTVWLKGIQGSKLSEVLIWKIITLVKTL